MRETIAACARKLRKASPAFTWRNLFFEVRRALGDGVVEDGQALGQVAGPGGVVVDHQVDAFADGEMCGVFLLFGELAADDGDGAGEGFRRRRARAQERITVAHRPGQSLGSKAPEPDRRVRSLHRLRLDGNAVDVTEPAVERHIGFVRPGRLHQFQALGEIRDEGVLVHTEGGEVASATPRCNTDIQPSVAEPVDGRHRRGQLKRLMQRRHQDRDSQPQSLGTGRAIRQQLQGRE